MTYLPPTPLTSTLRPEETLLWSVEAASAPAERFAMAGLLLLIGGINLICGCTGAQILAEAVNNPGAIEATAWLILGMWLFSIAVLIFVVVRLYGLRKTQVSYGVTDQRVLIARLHKGNLRTVEYGFAQLETITERRRFQRTYLLFNRPQPGAGFNYLDSLKLEPDVEASTVAQLIMDASQRYLNGGASPEPAAE